MRSKALFILPPHSDDIDKAKRPPWGIARIPPIGLLSLGSYLNTKGHEIKIIDSRFYVSEYYTKDYIPYLIEDIRDFKPDVIGINIITALFYEAVNICREIKNCFPNSLLIAGGVHPSVEPDLTFAQNQYIDAICIGPGEEICLDIPDGKNINNVQGLILKEGSSKFEKRAVPIDIDKYPFPNYMLTNNPNYYTSFTVNTVTNWGYKGLAVLTSRSCPYSCKFCASDWSKPYRFHSPEYVVELARYLSTFDIDVISFFDDTMAINKERLYKICEGFIRTGLFWPEGRLRWRCALRANETDLEILKLMKKAGCFSISIGVESGSDRMLKIINKKTTVEMNKMAYAYVREAGLHVGTNFMIGILGETEADMNETLSCMRSMNGGSVGIGVFRPLPGSPFYYELIANNTLLKDNIDWEDLGNFSVISKYTLCAVSKDKLERIFDKAFNMANVNSWTSIHEDSLNKYPELIKEIARLTRVKIVKSDNYDTAEHIDYAPFSFFLSFHDFLLQVYVRLPYNIRRILKVVINRLSKARFLKKWLWRY